ncbi:MAG: hypothetical protein M1834_003821 [Cirrosporium novae-zelandiae]|nr:MAG: hypothetical protein M1834_003821 [Cirrosporium novae-zelandiae]
MLLEVEQKFVVALSNLTKFRVNRGTPPFKSLKFSKNITFEDVYYDHNNILSGLGIWIRKRDNQWEAKRRISGDYLRSTFDETGNPDQIHGMLKDLIPYRVLKSPERNFGLDVLARFRTTRETYIANEKYTIVLDSTDFGHMVGEIEVMGEDETKAHQEIDNFRQQHSWFFESGNPEGKLSAYFRKFGRQQLFGERRSNGDQGVI